MTVRTRFAPSPTGYLHVGGARTALFCWLYARQHKGQFVLRIEDTDTARSTEESVQAILDGMAWLGLDYDEGPFYQTQRFDRYREVVQQLLDNGHAYYCYSTPAEVDAMREEARANGEKPRYNGYWRDRTDTPPAGIEPVVRFKNPLDGKVVIDDVVKGEIIIDNRELDDLVIMRSDGTPTYNLTVVVDDVDMQITDVIRGDDHVNNTPRQINILKAMGAPLPRYAHLPMILGEDGKRLSKRHGAVSVMQFAEDGYSADGLLNYLARLGWSHQDQELFSRDELISLFSLEAVNRSGGVFSEEKLNWVNQQHMVQTDDDVLGHSLAKRFSALGIDTHGGPGVAAVAGLMKERVHTINELADASVWFYKAPERYDAKAAKKNLTEKSIPALTSVRETLAALGDWQAAPIHQAISDTVAALEVGFGKVALPLRIAATGGTASPELDQTLALIGKNAVLTRIDTAIGRIESGAVITDGG